MKIKINYDLIDKIKESKNGISLKRSSKSFFVATGFATLLIAPSFMIAKNPIEELKDFLFITTSVGIPYRVIYDGFFFREFYKNKSLDKLKQLASMLRNNYVNTDYELLQSSYEYDRSYSIVLDERKIPRVKQDKYIMVPAADSFGEKEESLVQEHLIGSNEYELSCGSPSKAKVLIFAYSRM